ncbi:MAG: hypothetical protein ACM3PW_17415, partial [Chlamydiota bacterium]
TDSRLQAAVEKVRKLTEVRKLCRLETLAGSAFFAALHALLQRNRERQHVIAAGVVFCVDSASRFPRMSHQESKTFIGLFV